MLAVAGGLCPPRPVLPHRLAVHATASSCRPRRGSGCGTARRAAATGWLKPFGAVSAAITARDDRASGTCTATAPPARPSAGSPSTSARTPPSTRTRSTATRLTMDDYLSARDRSPRRSASTTATSRATARSPSSSPPPNRAATCPDPGARRGGRHADHRAHRVGPVHAHPRAPSARPAAHLWTADRACGPPTSTWPCSTTASPSTACPGSRRSASAASARPRTSSTAARTSPSTACCR